MSHSSDSLKGLALAVEPSPAYRQDRPPLIPNAFSQTFDRLVKAAGLPRIRLHDLGHTHATLALQAGVHPKVVSERLGHSTVSITLDIYSHAIPALQESTAELVAALVVGAPSGASPVTQ